MKSTNKILEEMYMDQVTRSIEEYCTPIYRDNGKTLIRNKSSLLTNQQLYRILSLLHSSYNDLGLTISIYSNWKQVLKDWLNPFREIIKYDELKLTVFKKASGIERGGVISIFPYLYKKDFSHEILKLKIVYVLFHEIRHSYQRKYFKKRYDINILKYVDKGHGYESQWIERDANHFAQRLMNKNISEINRILDIEFEWQCTWGRFKLILNTEDLDEQRK